MRARTALLLLPLLASPARAPNPTAVATPASPGFDGTRAAPAAPLVAERRAWGIMGTVLEVTVYRRAGERRRAVDDLRAAYAEIVAVDRRMSLYRDDSELVRLNARAGQGPTAVSAPLYAILAASLRYGRISGGAFDVTVTPLVELWGFYRQEGQVVPPPGAIAARRRTVGLDRLRLDPTGTGVELAPGTRVDLGAIAKGWAVDRAADALAGRGVPAALIDLGGNIRVVGTPPGGAVWGIDVRHPRAAGGILGHLGLGAGRSASTSGDYERFFEASGRRYSHIIDPRTGWPVRETLAVTVIAPDATTADALSTAVFVLGSRAGLALLRRIPSVEGLMVTIAAAGRGTGTAEVGSPSVGAPLRVLLTPGLAGGSAGGFELAAGVVAGVEVAGSRARDD